MSAHLTETTRPAVTGFVDAITETAAWGWAWSPGQAAPLSVELRLGEEIAAEAVADGLRADLARLGIGEGKHAFKLLVPEALRPRLADLHVVARSPDGVAVPLHTALSKDAAAQGGTAEQLAHLTRGMEMLIGSQRVLHRNVQAVLLAGPREEPALQGPMAGSDSAMTPATLQEAIETLELFVTRLEFGLAGLAAHQPRPAQPRWALIGIAAVAATALLLSVFALLRAMPG